MKRYILTFLVVVLVSGCKGGERSEAPSLPPTDQQKVKTESEDISPDKKGEVEEAKAVQRDHRPQIISLIVTPQFPKKGDIVKIEAETSDPDGDEVSLLFEWFKNDTPLSETSNTLKLTDDIRRGDKITANIIPYDGKRYGNAGFITVNIGNSPPDITLSPIDIEGMRDNKFFYKVNAADPDDDPLIYSLKGSPEGMMIDSSTGLIRWDVPPDFKGRSSITVSVTDGHGGEAVQSFTLEITPELKIKK